MRANSLSLSQEKLFSLHPTWTQKTIIPFPSKFLTHHLIFPTHSLARFPLRYISLSFSLSQSHTHMDGLDKRCDVGIETVAQGFPSHLYDCWSRPKLQWGNKTFGGRIRTQESAKREVTEFGRACDVACAAYFIRSSSTSSLALFLTIHFLPLLSVSFLCLSFAACCVALLLVCERERESVCVCESRNVE